MDSVNIDELKRSIQANDLINANLDIEARRNVELKFKTDCDLMYNAIIESVRNPRVPYLMRVPSKYYVIDKNDCLKRCDNIKSLLEELNIKAKCERTIYDVDDNIVVFNNRVVKF